MIKAPPMMLAQKYIALDLTIFDKWILDLGDKISIYKIIIISYKTCIIIKNFSKVLILNYYTQLGTKK